MKDRSYYEVLQVSKGASPEVIASAYRTLMMKLRKHPDLGGCCEEAILINQAYETLIDPYTRACYDALIATPEEVAAMESRADAPAERRRAPRKEVDAAISFCTDDGQLWHSGRVRDLSILGVRLQSREPVEIGQHIIIAPPDSSAYAVHGTVVWKRMFHPSHFERIYEAGVEFSDQISDIENRIY